MRWTSESAAVVAGATLSARTGHRLDTPRVEMLLGMDFLATHRVLVVGSQRRLYLSYLGGRPFRPYESSAAPE